MYVVFMREFEVMIADPPLSPPNFHTNLMDGQHNHVFPSPSAIEALRLELSLLRILHHRNKNQHHLQPFFKHLSILKRTLTHLLNNVDSDFLLRKLRQETVPKAWESFSRVVARGEFVTLGLVLCASVARISFCLGGVLEDGLDSQIEEMGEEIEEENDELEEVVLREMLVDETMEADEECTKPVAISHLPSTTIDESRSKMETDEHEVVLPTVNASAESDIGDIRPPVKKRRKQKPQDAIDMLFADLR